MEEFSFIDWIRRQTARDPRVPVGPGDDCAVVAFGGRRVLVTTDQCGDGVHFVLAECGPEAAGYKVMARSLSDIAAMGGRPAGAVATVALPRGADEGLAQGLYRGLRRAGDPFDCPVVGGDVMAWDAPLLLTVTMLGEPIREPVLRSTARVGDAICVTGALGGSLASGRHLSFTPRLAESAKLVERCDLHAMIDLSDGLASDLGHICRESGVGARLIGAAIPLTAAARAAAEPLRAALTDGEDYELLFTLAPDQADRLLAEPPFATPIARIGTAVEGSGITLVDPAGQARPLGALGWRHRT